MPANQGRNHVVDLSFDPRRIAKVMYPARGAGAPSEEFSHCQSMAILTVQGKLDECGNLAPETVAALTAHLTAVQHSLKERGVIFHAAMARSGLDRTVYISWRPNSAHVWECLYGQLEEILTTPHVTITPTAVLNDIVAKHLAAHGYAAK